MGPALMPGGGQGNEPACQPCVICYWATCHARVTEGKGNPMPRSMNEDDRPDDGGAGRHGAARRLAEAGLRAERAGIRPVPMNCLTKPGVPTPKHWKTCCGKIPFPAAVCRGRALAMTRALRA
ncbi:hypothetical protein RAA17_01260 [Komagataeibacter rhaeticus]|nr:hypothetical protein [Komagataeibacter rhaeticus]